MRCPRCSHQNTKVVDSRAVQEESAIRRRRECLSCDYRFTTYEYVEMPPIMVVKRSGDQEPYDRGKLVQSLQIACKKRPIVQETIESIVRKIEYELNQLAEESVESAKIGKLVMDALREVDDVAYVRFSSVYRQFTDLEHFKEALRMIESERKNPHDSS
ncbi:MAG: transcriptional repressor NrdR [Candidatus Marinimicrobia bacterium]|nr:transcriptional repressor NrdR [Candidatus Neomarinimicrobiota bacterium]